MNMRQMDGHILAGVLSQDLCVDHQYKANVTGDGDVAGSIHDERSSAELSTEVVLEVAPRTNVLYVGTIPRSR